MADESNPPMRRRAYVNRPPVETRLTFNSPTITIDTTAVNPNNQERPNSPISPDDAVSPTTTDTRPLELNTSMSFDKDSRPTSPHNVSSPVTSKSGDGAGFLAVPLNHRSRQNSVDSEDMSRSVSSQGDTTVVASNSTQVDTLKGSEYDHKKIINDETALKPDVGTEADFEVENNPFAFTPGQLNKMFNPKSLSAFYKLGGMDGLEKGLRTDRKAGLSVDEKCLYCQVSFELS